MVDFPQWISDEKLRRAYEAAKEAGEWKEDRGDG